MTLGIYHGTPRKILYTSAKHHGVYKEFSITFQFAPPAKMNIDR